MAWIIGIVIVLALIGAVSSNAKQVEQTEKKAKLNRRREEVIAAYHDYIRRTESNSEWIQMSEIELKELLRKSIIDFNDQIGLSSAIVGLGSIVCFFVGVVHGARESSWLILGGWIGGGLFLFTGIAAWREERIKKEFASRGFDVTRLEVKVSENE